MGLFQRVEGETAIITCGGVFRQCELYVLDGHLFAQVAGGFVRLYADGSTSKPNNVLHKLTWTGELAKDPLGRLALPGTPRTTSLPDDASTKLLGPAG